MGDPGEHVAQLVDGDAAAVVGEQELGGPPGAGVRQRPARGAVGDDAVDQGDGLLIERHHPFGVQLAERHLQPGTLPGDLVHAVEFEVDQFPDAQPGGALQQQRVGGQPVRPVLQRADEPAVQVRGQVARQRTGHFRDVGGEHQPAVRRLGPAPFGDVVEQTGHRQHPAAAFGHRYRRAGAGVDRLGGRGQVGLDVPASVQRGQAGQVRVDRGQMAGEVVEPARRPGDRATAVGGGQPVQVGHERRPQRRGGIAHPLLEALPQQARRVHRRRCEHAEVEQHLPGGVHRAL